MVAVRLKFFSWCVVSVAVLGAFVLWNTLTPEDPEPSHVADIDHAVVPTVTSGHNSIKTRLGHEGGRAGYSTQAMGVATRSVLGVDPIVASAALRMDHLCNEAPRLAEKAGVDSHPAEQIPIADYLGLDCSAARASPLSVEDAYDLAVLAAEAGNVDAQLRFRAYGAAKIEDERFALDPEAIADYREKTFRYLNMAVSQGEDSALFVLSGLYAGEFAPDADPVRAYAYALAYRNVSMKAPAELLVKNAREKLTSAQVSAGKRLAEQIVQQQKGISQ